MTEFEDARKANYHHKLYSNFDMLFEDKLDGIIEKEFMPVLFGIYCQGYADAEEELRNAAG